MKAFNLMVFLLVQIWICGSLKSKGVKRFCGDVHGRHSTCGALSAKQLFPATMTRGMRGLALNETEDEFIIKGGFLTYVRVPPTDVESNWKLKATFVNENNKKYILHCYEVGGMKVARVVREGNIKTVPKANITLDGPCFPVEKINGKLAVKEEGKDTMVGMNLARSGSFDLVKLKESERFDNLKPNTYNLNGGESQWKIRAP